MGGKKKQLVKRSTLGQDLWAALAFIGK